VLAFSLRLKSPRIGTAGFCFLRRTVFSTEQLGKSFNHFAQDFGERTERLDTLHHYFPLFGEECEKSLIFRRFFLNLTSGENQRHQAT
jgi:hypothetical protein